MRCKRSQNGNQSINGVFHKGLVCFFQFFISVQLVNKLHDRADGCIKAESSPNVIGYFFNRSIEDIIQFFICICLDFICNIATFPFLMEIVDKTVYTVQESVASFHSRVRPVQFSFRRSRKQNEKPCSICTIFIDNFLRAYNISERFTHLLAILVYHTLGQQVPKRLFLAYKPQIIQSHLEETGIHQMQNGMFHTADVLIHIHPVICLGFVKSFLLIFRITVSEEIPGRIQECIHGIHFSSCFFPASRADAFGKCLGSCQRRFSLAGKFNISRKKYRQIFLFFRYPSAVVTVNHRNRCSPVSLSGDQPVTKSVVNGLLSYPLFFQPLNNSRNGILVIHAVKFAGIDHGSFCRKGFCQVVYVNGRIF